MSNLHGFFTPRSLPSSPHWGVAPLAFPLVARLVRCFAKVEMTSGLVKEARDDGSDDLGMRRTQLKAVQHGAGLCVLYKLFIRPL
jgi:hypothetical protein